MKIRNFKIENFKSLKNISVDNSHDFHSLIGSNSAGKTSVFDALNIIKKIGAEFHHPELITNGVTDYETKAITTDLVIELDKEERKNYLIHSFGIEESKVNYILNNNEDILSEIDLQITIMIYGSKVSKKYADNHVFLSSLKIFTDAGYVNLINSNPKNDTLDIRRDFGPSKVMYKTDFANYVNRVGFARSNITETNYLNGGIFLGRFLKDLQENLRYIEAIRETNKKVPTTYFERESDIGQRGEQLPNFMDTLWTNQPERYLQIEKYCKAIFPNIEKIRPKKLPNNELIIEIHKKNIDTPISLDNDGRGVDQSLVIIWRISTSPKNTIWLIDEPEIHLHPGAQKLLYEFFQDEISRGKQIIVSTHSMVFIHRCNKEQISILLFKDGITELSSLGSLVSAETNEDMNESQARDIVYDALGYDSSQSLERTTIVAVEGKTDEMILKIFAKILEKDIDEKMVRFIPVGNKNDAKKITPILKYAISKKTLIILDNDNQKPEEVKQSIKSQENEYKKKIGIRNQILKDEEFCFYDKEIYSIESYLLNAEAIGKAGELSNEDIEKIRVKIISELEKPKKDRQKPKDMLSNIWADFGVGVYDEKSPENIAKNLPKSVLLQHPEILEIIDKINGDYQVTE